MNLALSPLIVLPITMFSSTLGSGLLQTPGISTFVLSLVILDLYLYWWHRANHVIPFLWRFHQVHHLDQTLDTTSALRFHFGEVILSAVARGTVILILGIRIDVVLVFETMVLVLTLFHHSNLYVPHSIDRFISKLIVTPSIHWVHHHTKRIEMDTNYATILSLWDPLFKSRNTHIARTEGMPIGVQNKPDQDLLRLITLPLQ